MQIFLETQLHRIKNTNLLCYKTYIIYYARMQKRVYTRSDIGQI